MERKYNRTESKSFRMTSNLEFSLLLSYRKLILPLGSSLTGLLRSCYSPEEVTTSVPVIGENGVEYREEIITNLLKPLYFRAYAL
jgi:hypothetical protein